MKILVNGEETFRSRGNNMAIAPTSNGYTLEFSVDNTIFSAYGDAIPAGENLLISDAVSGMYFRMAGNTDENVTVRF